MQSCRGTRPCTPRNARIAPRRVLGLPTESFVVEDQSDNSYYWCCGFRLGPLTIAGLRSWACRQVSWARPRQ